MSSRSRSLPAVEVKPRWLREPKLGFADGAEHIDPKIGIPYTGPRSLGTVRHRVPITTGFIGTAQGVELGRKYFEDIAAGVAGDEDHHPFPGFLPDRGFRTQLRTDDSLTQLLTASDVRNIMGEGVRSIDRFELLLEALERALRQLTEQDVALDLIVIVLPDDVVKRCRVAKYREAGELIQRDLRAALKAMAMRYRIPTQILKESTTGLSDSSSGSTSHPADVAWNLCTALYFKAGGFPWSPLGLGEGTCYIGISFFRPHGDRSSLRTSVAQAFSENGDAFVLRGHQFTWEGRWPHLPAEHARDLVQLTLDRYELEYRRPPRRVVIHKQSRFDASERDGFEDALTGLEYDLVAVRQSSDFRLLRQGQYPPPRGTAFAVGDRTFLYTTGTIPELGFYPHGHVPAPLQIADHVGDSSSDQLLTDILILTKMNWNSARYAEHTPVTLRFAHLVGKVLREVAPDEQPHPKYSFYM